MATADIPPDREPAIRMIAMPATVRTHDKVDGYGGEIVTVTVPRNGQGS